MSQIYDVDVNLKTDDITWNIFHLTKSFIPFVTVMTRVVTNMSCNLSRNKWCIIACTRDVTPSETTWRCGRTSDGQQRASFRLAWLFKSGWVEEDKEGEREEEENEENEEEDEVEEEEEDGKEENEEEEEEEQGK